MNNKLKIKTRFNDSELVANWYEVKKLKKNLYLVDEQDHVAFFILRDGSHAYLFDSGLGLSGEKADELFDYLNIQSFDVVATHSHCDHSGLNYKADNIYIYESEWDKYESSGEVGQISSYCELIGEDLPWPVPRNELPKFQRSWAPSYFIEDGQVLQLGQWNLEACLLPGHTCGHMAFIERSEKVVFLGDFVVSGTNYIHLKDSSIQDYYESVEKLKKISLTLGDGVMFLSCHDQIPLESTYVDELWSALEKINNQQIKPQSTWEKSTVFEEAWVYDTGSVRIAIRKDQLDVE